MASPPIPPSLEHLGTRPFSFYPPIINVEHNEWLFRKATWSEILVVNCKTGEEVWIPRRSLGEVSRVDDPVLIVGLNRELEYKGGSVWPYQRRVIEMPVAVGGGVAKPVADAGRSEPAPIVGIRLESSDRRVLRLIATAVGIAIALYVGAVSLNRVGELRQRTVTYTARDEAFLNLGGHDDYVAVVAKLGAPASDRWHEAGDIQYRALAYPDRKYTVILMGADRSHAVYIGTLDDNWKPVHSSGQGTSALLRNLKRF
jgi:hypothetical protein